MLKNIDYQKAQKGQTTCSECKYSRPRWWSNRLECAYVANSDICYAVAKKNTCKNACPRPKDTPEKGKPFSAGESA